MSSVMLEIEHLTKRYGEHVAVDDLSLSAKRGDILGFVGPNGAGKTTTIQVLVGLLRPTSGAARIAGLDCVRDTRAVRQRIGFMPDTFAGYDNMRVSEYLDFFAAAFGIQRQRRAAALDKALELAGAAHMRDLYTQALSHGMKQRVSLARALLHEPEMLILDEPTNGLDPVARVEMREAIVKLAKAGKTVLVTSHILPELASICTEIAIITRGRLRAHGSLSEITRQVRQVRRFEVILLNAKQAEAAQRVLREQFAGTGQVVWSQAEGLMRVETSADDAVLAAALAALVQAGVPVLQFREMQIGLEDAFLALLQEQPAAVAAGEV